jgi:hypothetical protein
MPYSKHVKFAVCVGAELTALGAGCLPACAQVLYGAIVGTAVDQGSSAIPEATVKITSVGTSQSREALTDRSCVTSSFTSGVGRELTSASTQLTVWLTLSIRAS